MRIENLVLELERQQAQRVDMVANNGGIVFDTYEHPDGVLKPGIGLRAANIGSCPLLPDALKQVGARMEPDVPGGFLERLAEQRPDVAVNLLNRLRDGNWNTKHLVRVLDGKVRAVLSDRYRCLDHYALAFKAMEVAKDNQASVIKSTLTNKRMEISFTTKRVWEEFEEMRSERARNRGNLHEFIGAKRLLGDISDQWVIKELPGGPGAVFPMVRISNSETGHGALTAQIGMVTKMCLNMAIVEDVVAKIHLGDRLDTGILSREAVDADSRAIMLKARDSISAAFDPSCFKRICAKARKAGQTAIEGEPSEIVDGLVSAGTVAQSDRDALLTYFVGDYSRTKLGLSQAVSRLAQDTDDPEYCRDLERAAGKLLVA